VLPGERKSVQPMAAITAPEYTAAQHQSLSHFVGAGGWSDMRCWAKFVRCPNPYRIDATGQHISSRCK
jgi:hypothetical protein